MNNTGTNTNFIKNLWDKLAGSRDVLPLQNRVFNAICAISFVMVSGFILIDLLLGFYTMAIGFTGSLVVISILYYASRVKNKYRISSTVYFVLLFAILVSNFFFNEGIDGPTLMGFFVSFHFITGMRSSRQYWMWLFIHIVVVLALMLVQYYIPQSIIHVYTSPQERLIDIWLTYIVILMFIFSLANYIRDDFAAEKEIAQKRADDIEAQHLQIAVQHMELENLNHEKDKLFSIISHDLKSPLDSITSYLEVLASDTLQEDERKEIEQNLLSITQTTSNMLYNLLSWSKSQLKGNGISMMPLHLPQVLKNTLDMQLKLAEAKGVHLSYDIDVQVPVMADTHMLKLVMRNLISNSIKFTEQGGTVFIRGYLQGSKCIIEVKDTGIGMSVMQQAKAFSLRSNTTYGTMNEKGVGLGLVLCKEFTERQGGKIWFESAEGKGTTFYISLAMQIAPVSA